MIGRDMKAYPYYLVGDRDSYGQQTIGTEPAGALQVAIYSTTQAVADTVLYSEAEYIGLTRGAVTDAFVIDYKGKLLKVLYVQPKGRYKQAFMRRL